jgi:hypothetical protein
MRIMRWFPRISVSALLGVALLGLGGCAQDNEDFVKAQAAANANKAPVAGAKGPPKDMNEYGKQQQQPFSKGAGYPGAR